MKLSKHQLGAVLVALLLLASGVAAYSAIFDAGAGTSYETGSGLVVDTTTDHGLDGTNPFNDSETVYIDGVSISASGDADVTVDQFRGDRTKLSSIGTNGTTITVDPDDKSRVEISGGVTALSWEDAAIDGSNQITYSASSSGTITVTGLEADADWTAATPSGEFVDGGTTSADGEAVISVGSAADKELLLFDNDAPSVDNDSASPTNGTLIQPSGDLSINVSDDQFGSEQGDELAVEWYVDGEKRGETTVTDNGTASFEPDSITGGEHTWHAVVTDSYGAETTTETFNFSAPSELRVFSESDPDQLIDDNVSLRVRFFADGGDVVEREVTDGTVDLAGLPANERFIVTVRANDTDAWTYRRIVIDSLIETNAIYLLNESEPHSQVVFELDDPTGQFPPEETTLYVEKPITKDYDGDNETETRYQVIAGDTFGASGDFPVILQQKERYRLRVETRDGEASRILGFYSVSGPATERLQIQRVAPDPDADEGVSIRATIEERDDGDYIAIRYDDFDDATEQVEYTVVDSNGTVVVPTTTRTADSFADIYPVPAGYGEDASFTVNYEIVREDSSSTGSIRIGDVSEIAQRFGLDPQILTLLSYLGILGTMGLVVINNARVAPFAGVAVASGMVVIGTVSIPLVVLSVAGIISILVLVGGDQ